MLHSHPSLLFKHSLVNILNVSLLQLLLAQPDNRIFLDAETLIKHYKYPSFQPKLTPKTSLHRKGQVFLIETTIKYQLYHQCLTGHNLQRQPRPHYIRALASYTA